MLVQDKIDFFKKHYIHLAFQYRTIRTAKLARYIFKELLSYFLTMFFFFFLIFFVNNLLLLAKDLLGKHVPFSDVMRLMLYSTPFVIAQSAPFATLTGFLMCLGRMVSDNEILIFRASGLSPLRIITVPVIILGIAISIFSYFVNDFILPRGAIKYRELLRISAAANPSVLLESNSVKRLNNATIIVGNVNNEEVSDIVFLDRDNDFNHRIIIAGKSKAYPSKTPGVIMEMEMNDSLVTILNKSKASTFDTLSSDKMIMRIFDNSIEGLDSSITPQQMTSTDLRHEIKKMKTDKEISKKTLNLYFLEYSKKFSIPFGSIFFAFMAIPIALSVGKHNGQTIGFIAGLLISFAYWAVTIIGQNLAVKNGINAVLMAWIPNIIIGIAGSLCYLLMRKK